jgi:hypothetical protein
VLKLSVLPEDVAEAVAFFVSDASAKLTGNVINVARATPRRFRADRVAR